MTARLLVPFWSPEEVEAAIPRAVAHLNERKVLAYPTETVYGLGGAIDSDSVGALVSLKGRSPDKPFLLLLSGADMLGRLGVHLSPCASRLAAQFWPGPLTMVLPGAEKRVPKTLRGSNGGVAVRWTAHKGLARLIAAYGQPITSTSANRPGVEPAMTADEIGAQWREVIRSGALQLLDGGRLASSASSTVVDCTGNAARIIRPGAITEQQLLDAGADLAPTSAPG